MPHWETIEKLGQTRCVPDTLLGELSAFVAERMGLRFPRSNWGDLDRGLTSAAREFGFGDLETFAQWVVSSQPSKEHTEILASHLTVGETYFFRDKTAFEILEQRMLPDLIRARYAEGRRLKIWSAGCCTGEEAYSIAMVIDRAVPDASEWRIDIVATDINRHFLRKAEAGVYTEWSFRQTPPWLREKYFRKTDTNKFEILPRIKSMVEFEYLNLAEDVYPSFLINLYA
ncbi:MAG: CheR family methyltransferase, partial [bacterium]